MDWTQIVITFLITLPATLAAIGAFIASLRGNRKIEENTDLTKMAANAISKQNVEQTSKLLEVDKKTTTIAKAVNGDLDARFRRLEDAIEAIHAKLWGERK